MLHQLIPIGCICDSFVPTICERGSGAEGGEGRRSNEGKKNVDGALPRPFSLPSESKRKGDSEGLTDFTSL